MDGVFRVLEQVIQERFIDPQNSQEFSRALQILQPEIALRIRARRADVQRMLAHGATPYAVVGLHVVYRSAELVQGGGTYSRFSSVSIEDVAIEAEPRESERLYYQYDSLWDQFTIDQFRRVFLNELHVLQTYSVEIPAEPAFSPIRLSELAQSLVSMHQYVVGLTTRTTDLSAEAVGVVREMRRLAERGCDLADPFAVARLRDELIVAAQWNLVVVEQILALLTA